MSFVNLTTVGLFTINFYRILRNWVSILFNENVEYKRRWVTWEGWRMTAGRREVSMTASMGGGWPLGGEGWVWPPARVEYDRCSRRMGRLLQSSTNPYPLAPINYFPAGIFSSHLTRRALNCFWLTRKKPDSSRSFRCDLFPVQTSISAIFGLIRQMTN